MPEFSYVARSRSGKLVSGVLKAPSREVLFDRLTGQGYYVVSINERKRSWLEFDFSSIADAWTGGVSSSDLVRFTSLMATMLGAGVSVINSFDVIIEQTANQKFREILKRVRDDVEGGMQISDAMAKFPKVFSPLYIAMVRVGEVGGGLSDTLHHLSSVLEAQADIRARIKTALTYPVILSVVAVIIVSFLLTFVMPRFLRIFTEAGVELPGLTKNVMAISSWMRHNWYIILAVIGGIVGFYKYYVGTEEGRYKVDSLKLKLPVVGELIRKMSISRFTRIFGTLMGKGVPVLETLDVVHETISNAVIRKVVDDVRAGVKAGRNISDPLEESGVIPPMVVQVVKVGEESGEIEKVSAELADFFDKEVDRTISRLVTILEPLMIIIVGGIVALLVFSCILPMFDMMRVYR